MDIRVSGHQMDTGEALREHVTTRLQGLADKYFSRSISAQVTFGPGPHNQCTCDIIAHVMQGVILKGHGQATEAHPAFDQAADRIEKQLRRYMKRLKARNAGAQAAAVADAFDGEAGYTVFDSGAADAEEPADNPLIIAETRVDIPDASVSDAVMMLDLRNTNALLFKNSGTGAFNMVYRRPDGTIGWVEPSRAA
ncbi:ribosome hibernation-promoting factor, HPF/YfiA family [Sphingomonas jatrophae]|uniref:Ribosome hibernation promoting factor n=1 Tax=Sphingomonas jatrophae TaxID=1166337 RepID=A0A1I6LP85_9SPHN|nr:ribosome-associated translation inhibitor RaiA [Sphingomonas jatrophae]SFS05090.1 ribosomal subunit interface protein [Sphingomonas jatrophae]